MMGPMRASVTIKAKLEKFKLNMPLIGALCNPGIKKRHWDMMSEKVGAGIEEEVFTGRNECTFFTNAKILKEMDGLYWF